MPSVKSIYQYAFRGCNSLSVVDLPVVEKIDGTAFFSLKNITALILRNTEKVCEWLVLDATGGSMISQSTNGYIYIPSNLIDSYRAEDCRWHYYANQFRVLEDYTVDGTTTGALDETKI